MKLIFNLLPSTIKDIEFTPRRGDLLKSPVNFLDLKRGDPYRIKSVKKYSEVFHSLPEDDHLVVKFSGLQEWWDVAYFKPVLKFKKLLK